MIFKTRISPRFSRKKAFFSKTFGHRYGYHFYTAQKFFIRWFGNSPFSVKFVQNLLGNISHPVSLEIGIVWGLLFRFPRPAASKKPPDVSLGTRALPDLTGVPDRGRKTFGKEGCRFELGNYKANRTIERAWTIN